jgi:AcrR family transcriptional regulator
MATVKNSNDTEALTKDRLISLYMDHVLENEQTPKTIYKFSKINGFSEEEFYRHFGSFEALEKGIWEQFYEQTILVIQKSADYPAFSNREKMLTLYFTFFEMLTANRSYVLFILKKNRNGMEALEQLKGLRRKIKDFAAELIREENEGKQVKILKRSETVFSEAAWIQLLFLLKFWMNDNSANFESTDVAIEKSVNTVFEVFDNTPLERIFDLSKFLWKERRA